MPKELLLQILNQKLYFQLLLIILAHGVCWFIFISFGVYLLTKQINFVRILPFVALGVLCTLFGRMILPNILFSFVVLTIFCFANKILAKVTIVEAAIISITTYITLGISAFIIEEPLFSLFPHSINFIMKTPLGVVVGSLFETVLPLLLLFTIHALQFQPKLFVPKKFTFLDIAELLLMLILFYWFYDTSIEIFRNYTIHQVFPLRIISQWIGAIGGILAFYVILMYFRKDSNKQAEAHAKQLQANEELKRQLQEMIDNAVNNKAKDQENEEKGTEIFENLPDYERKFLKLLAEGKMYTEIADLLNVTEGRVRAIASRLMQKFDFQDKTQLAVFAIKKLNL